MGTACSSEGNNPNPVKNQPHVRVGDRPDENNSDWEGTTMPEFCTLAGVGGNGYRRTYCDKMSNAGEWGDSQELGSCNYKDSGSGKNVTKWRAGCCRGICSIAGKELSCKRLKFTGDPLICCLNDYECHESNIHDVYSDGSHENNTCADGHNGQHNYRSSSSSSCFDSMYEYFTGTQDGDDYNSNQWFDRWTESGRKSGLYVIQRVMFKEMHPGLCAPLPSPPLKGICNQPPPYTLSASGTMWGQQVMEGVIRHYEDLGYVLGAMPGMVGYHSFQDFLYDNIACPFPWLMQTALRNACSKYTAQRISFTPNVAKWCGCHLDPNEYFRFSSEYNIPPECTPTCNTVGTIPITGIDGKQKACTKNICLIDDINVNLINSKIGGGVDFSQICGDCEFGQCSCIIDNDTVDIVNSTIGGTLTPIAQGCGGSVKTQTNPSVTGPNVLDVGPDAENFNPYLEYERELAQAEEEAAKISTSFVLIIAMVSMVIIFFLILFKLRRSK